MKESSWIIVAEQGGSFLECDLTVKVVKCAHRQGRQVEGTDLPSTAAQQIHILDALLNALLTLSDHMLPQ
jgi:hypothetical protein